MIADLKPYPWMKDSGVPWLGEVPKHWEVRRQRNVVEMLVSNVDKLSNEREVSVRLCNYVDVYKNERITDRISFMRATAKREEIERFRLRFGDVLITKDSETWNDIGVPALVEYAASDLVCGYHLALLRPRAGLIQGVYLHRALQSPAVAYQYHISANGVTRYGLSHDAIKSVLLPIPSIPEQSAIVRFLDHADRRIRRYIRAKQELIKLLEEQKQAIIHCAVTRGLDPNGPIQPLGSAPASSVNGRWQIVRLWQIAQLRSEKNRPDLGLLSVFLGRGVIPYTEGGGQVHKPSLDLIGYQVVHPGDLVLNNQQAWRGSVGVSAHLGIISPAYVVLALDDSLRHRFADYLFQSRVMVSQYVTSSKGVGDIQRDVHIPWLKNIRVPLPPREEQEVIVRNLDRELAELNRQVSIYRRECELLGEYRIRLIADVVTGKLDVREAAAKLQDEAEEPEALGDIDALVEDEGATDVEVDAEAEEAEA